MSATDELRRLLDERGVEYETYIEQPTGFEHVKWNFSEHGSADFNLEFGEPWLTMYGVISGPEQAIAATLGAGTCHNTQFAEMDEKAGKKYSMAMSALRFGGFMPEDEPAEFTCSACEKTALIDWETLYDIRFCPFCGAKVVDERNDV